MPKKRHPKRRRSRAAHDRFTGRDRVVRLTHALPAEKREVLHDYFESGWARWLPIALYSVLLGSVGALDDIDLGRQVWPEDAPTDHDERQELDRARNDAARFAAHAGLPFPETWANLLVLARYYGLLVDTDEGVALAQPFPLVTETGVLTAEEIAQEDAVRWSGQYEPLAQRIIRLFVDGNFDEWSGTLAQLAGVIDTTVDDTRHAVDQLVSEQDFACDPDPSTLPVDGQLTIRVDWAEFDRNRITLAGPSSTDEDR